MRSSIVRASPNAEALVYCAAQTGEVPATYLATGTCVRLTFPFGEALSVTRSRNSWRAEVTIHGVTRITSATNAYDAVANALELTPASPFMVAWVVGEVILSPYHGDGSRGIVDTTVFLRDALTLRKEAP